MKRKLTPFRSAREEIIHQTPQVSALTQKGAGDYLHSNQLAFLDRDFMLQESLRPMRLQLELMKADMILKEHNIESTIVVFGSARILPPEKANEELEKAQEAYHKHHTIENGNKVNFFEMRVKQSRYYAEAQEFGRLVSSFCQDKEHSNYVITTGGGPGIMEAANRGALDAQCKSVGLNILLPYEQMPNPYITPELSFHFHYFAIRKMHFLLRAQALVAFPGGYGTLDELFETLTLMQTNKINRIPIILFGRSFWEKLINWDHFVEEGLIDPSDLNLLHYVENAKEAWTYIADFHSTKNE